MRERELKLETISGHDMVDEVAPHAGARIETAASARTCAASMVAPHVGAVSRVTQ